MINFLAGKAVDDTIHQLLPFLESGDIIIDGGNSEYTDTQRRCKEMKEKNLLFIGMGVSGGEEGARHGPSLMPGGHVEAWYAIERLAELFFDCNDFYTGLLLNTFFNQLPPKLIKNLAVIGLAMMELDTLLKWFTMVLNMVICSFAVKHILYSKIVLNLVIMRLETFLKLGIKQN